VTSARGVLIVAALLAPPAAAHADPWIVPELAPPPTTALRVDTDATAVLGVADLSSAGASGLVTARVGLGDWALALRAGVVGWRGRDRRDGILLSDGVARSTITAGVARWWRRPPTAWQPVVRGQLLVPTHALHPIDALRFGPTALADNSTVPLLTVAGGARRTTAGWIVQLEAGLDGTAHEDPHAPHPFVYLWAAGTVGRRLAPGTTVGATLLVRAALTDADNADNAGAVGGVAVEQRVGPGRLAVGARLRLDQLATLPTQLTLGYELALP